MNKRIGLFVIPLILLLYGFYVARTAESFGAIGGAIIAVIGVIGLMLGALFIPLEKKVLMWDNVPFWVYPLISIALLFVGFIILLVFIGVTG